MFRMRQRVPPTSKWLSYSHHNNSSSPSPLPTSITTKSADDDNGDGDEHGTTTTSLARTKSHAPVSEQTYLWWVWCHRMFAALVLFYVANAIVYQSLTPPVLPNLNHLHLMPTHHGAGESGNHEGHYIEKEMGEESLSTFLTTHQNCSSHTTTASLSLSNLVKLDTQAQSAGVKTLWMPSYPDTMDEQLLKTFVSSVTGLTAPVKAYYLQSKDLRRCQSKSTTTVFCTIVHPMVELKPPPTASKFTAYMDSSIVYLLRNPKTLFPAHFNGKAIKYHGATGQVGIHEWRQFRNQYLPNLLTGWKKQIRAWLPGDNKQDNGNYYRVALWLPLEHYLHPDQGPALAKSLVDILQTTGYSTTVSSMNDKHSSIRKTTASTDSSNSEIPCLWYTSVADTMHRMQHQGDYFDFTTHYVPGYTRAQRDLMLREVQSLMEEVSSRAPELVPILKEYYEDIRDHTVIDEDDSPAEQAEAHRR